jgi:hypothetical protein
MSRLRPLCCAVVLQVFWLDEGDDCEHAPDEVSWCGAEVGERSAEFARSVGRYQPVAFTVTGWRLAVTVCRAGAPCWAGAARLGWLTGAITGSQARAWGGAPRR